MEKWFFNFHDVRGIGHLLRIFNLDQAAVGQRHAVANAGRGREQLEIELALEPLLDDLHVQEAEEAAAETEAQGGRVLRFIRERCIVELELRDGVAQVFVLLGDDRKEAGEDHRLHFLKSRQRHGIGFRLGDGVADLRLDDVADVGEEEADFPDAEGLDRLRFRREDPELGDLVLAPRGHHLDLHAFVQLAVDHPHEADDAAIRVVPGVEQHRAQRPGGVAFRRRNVRDDLLEDLFDADAGLRRCEHRVVRVDPDHVLDLLAHALRLRGRQVDFVDHGKNREIVVDGEIAVRERLRLDTLRRIHDENRALARRETARDFVAEVDVPRRVDEVEGVLLPVLGLVLERDRARLDRDATLALEIHVVEHLLVHIALLDGTRHLQQPVRQRRLAVIDVRDDGEVPDVPRLRHSRAI